MNRSIAIKELEIALEYLDEARGRIAGKLYDIERWYSTDNPSQDLADAIHAVVKDVSSVYDTTNRHFT